ncbi:MAG: DUF2889 domain-containing protein [Pseudomonadota bacterium]
MPLSPPVQREALHKRLYEMRGYQRKDGLWDIEGLIVDTKTYAFENEFRGTIEPDVPLHEMVIRLTLDDDFVVRDIEGVTENGPFEVCPSITPNLKKMIGRKVGPGWRKAIRQNLGGVEGCTHLSELLGAMATVAYQTLYPTLAKRERGKPREGKPGLLNSCHAFRSDGEITKKSWPEFYTGPRDLD